MIVVLCGVFCVIGAVFMKGFWGQLSSTAGCMATFEMTQNAAIAYSVEHDGKLPNVATWQDDIKPYYERLYKKMSTEVKDAEMLKGFLPPAPGMPLECKGDGRSTGVAFNSNVGGKKISDFKDPTKTVTFFETDQVLKNLSMPYQAMPKSKKPKLMNEDREWIIYYIEGNTDPFETSNSTSNTFEMSPEDAMTPKEKK